MEVLDCSRRYIPSFKRLEEGKDNPKEVHKPGAGSGARRKRTVLEDGRVHGPGGQAISIWSDPVVLGIDDTHHLSQQTTILNRIRKGRVSQKRKVEQTLDERPARVPQIKKFTVSTLHQTHGEKHLEREGKPPYLKTMPKERLLI